MTIFKIVNNNSMKYLIKKKWSYFEIKNMLIKSQDISFAMKIDIVRKFLKLFK